MKLITYLVLAVAILYSATLFVDYRDAIIYEAVVAPQQAPEPTPVSPREHFDVQIGEYDDPALETLAEAIIEAESNFRNVCNTGGCRYGIGPFQIVQSTFDEQCEGDVYDTEDNIRCGLKMLDAGQVWRWRQSQAVWGVDNY